jgi:hypothetical protein
VVAVNTPEGLSTEEVYERVWKEYVEPNGVIDLNAVKTLLFDYGATLHNLALLYPYLTNGQVTNPQAPVDEVMAASDRYIADTLDGELEKILEYLLNQDDPTAAIALLLESGNPVEEASD